MRVFNTGPLGPVAAGGGICAKNQLGGTTMETTVDTTLNLRVNNALLLAQAMGLDLTNPVDAQKVMSYLRTVERYVRSDSGD